jgi:hypothetical protein
LFQQAAKVAGDEAHPPTAAAHRRGVGAGRTTTGVPGAGPVHAARQRGRPAAGRHTGATGEGATACWSGWRGHGTPRCVSTPPRAVPTASWGRRWASPGRRFSLAAEPC